MSTSTVAKLFMDGESQAVCLPPEFHFECSEVYISRDDASGDVVLSTRPGSKAWAEFFKHQQAMDDSEILQGFMLERPMNQLPVEKHLSENTNDSVEPSSTR